MLSTLLFSQGTPMILGGDEFGRTQQGNNNAYCQDSDISWFDWNFSEDAKDLLEFSKRLIKLRQTYPVLRRNRFLTGQHDDQLDVRDVTWINANGGEVQDSQWKDASMKCFGMLLDGRAPKTGIRKLGKDETMLVVVNGYEGLVDFTLPEAPAGSKWSLLIDTKFPDSAPGPEFGSGKSYQVTGRSFLLFSLNK